MTDYSKITNDEFHEAVRKVANRIGVNAILDIPGVYEHVSEELNNEALDLCTEDAEERNETTCDDCSLNMSCTATAAQVDACHAQQRAMLTTLKAKGE